MAADGDTIFGWLHTPAGAVVFWDAALGRVVHATEGKRNLACLTNGRNAHLIVFDPATAGVVGNLAAGADGGLALVAPESAHWWDVEESGAALGLLAPAGRLVWLADGTVEVGEPGDAAVGWFLAVSSLTEACLRSLEAETWIQANGTPPVRVADGGAEPALRLGGEMVRLGGVPGPFVVAEAAGDGMKRQLHVVGAQGRLHRLALFRPVICLSVFGDEAYYDALGLALDALHRFGGYEGAVCIGADRPREAVAAYVPAAYRDSWLHVTVPANVGLFGRYGIEAWGLEAYQPVLYMDADVVANARLRPMLVQLALSPRVHVATERDLEDGFTGQTAADLAESDVAAWFGGWLFAADPRFRGRMPAFGSSGVIGADHVSRLAVPFALVQALRRVVEPARIAAYTDQALANYALHVCSAGFGLLNGFVDFARSAEQAGSARRGLMHFHSGVGSGWLKREAMQRYIAQLEQAKA